MNHLVFSRGQKLFALLAMVFVFGALSQFTTTGQNLTAGIIAAVFSYFGEDTEDISSLEQFHGQAIWKGYEQNGIYQLKRDLFFGKLVPSLHDEYELFPPWDEPGQAGFTRYITQSDETGENSDLNPASIAAFEQNPSKWGHIKGVITKGTRLEMTQVIYQQSIDFRDFFYIARVIDGPFAGRSVMLNLISTGSHGSAKSCDTAYLELISSE